MDFLRRPTALARRAQSPVAASVATERAAAAPLVIAAGWRSAAIMSACAVLGFGVVFHHEARVAFDTWIGTTAYNHCFLILPLIGFLLWERRAIFTVVSPQPTFWPLAALPLLSAIWLAAAVLDINEGRQLVVVTMFEVLLLATLGLRAFKLLLAPLLFLFFLVPSGEFLIPPLQKVTANITVHGLQLLQVPVYREGFMIEIPEGRFEIAEACAGLRFLIASIVFGFFFSVVMYRRLWKRAAFIVLSLVVPVGANGLRALGTIYLGHLEGSAAAVEADHILYGWVFFSLVILLLIVVGTRFADADGPPPAVAAAAAPRGLSWRCAAVGTAGLLLAVAGPAYGAVLNDRFQASVLPLARLSEPAPPWHPVSGEPAWSPMIRAGAEHDWLQSFAEPRSADSGTVIRYVAVYRLHPIGNALTRADNRVADDLAWQTAAQGTEEIRYGDHRVPVTSTQIVSGSRRRLVWSFYIVDGTVASAPLNAKLLQAQEVLLRGASFAAFVAISASADDPEVPARRQLETFVQANSSLFGQLEALSLGRAASADRGGK
jgi:exosortase A